MERFLDRYGGSAKQERRGVFEELTFGSGKVKGAGAACSRAFHHMEVDHGDFDTGMPHEGLDSPDVSAGFKQVCSEGMAHGVAGGALRDGGLADGIPELALHGGFVQVVAGNFSTAGMRAEGHGWEYILPTPLAAGVGPFAQQGFGHVDVSRSDDEILQVFFAGFGEVFMQP